jgi:hypothetical protein
MLSITLKKKKQKSQENTTKQMQSEIRQTPHYTKKKRRKEKKRTNTPYKSPQGQTSLRNHQKPPHHQNKPKPQRVNGILREPESQAPRKYEPTRHPGGATKKATWRA